MDFLVCVYPLYMTYEYYHDDNTIIDKNIYDTSFLVTWWSSFGICTLLERYVGLGSFPLYSVWKGMTLVSMYSTSYRELIINRILFGLSTVWEKGRQIGISIINERFPSLNQYIRINSFEKERRNGWFNGWL